MIQGLTGSLRLAKLATSFFPFASFACSAAVLLAFLLRAVPAHFKSQPGSLAAEAGTSLTRAELLACMWGPPFSEAGIVAGSVLVLAIAFAGALALQKLRTPLATSLAGFALCVGLAGGWALLTPPLQAPDEIDQFLGFFEKPLLTSQASPDILAWANRMHFERIKFRRSEGFNGAHLAAPLSSHWGWHIAPVDMQSRSPLTFKAWQSLAEEFSTSGFSAGTWLLGLRIINVLALALAFSIAGLAISYVGRKQPAHGSRPDFLAFIGILLLIPTFCFFSMHVSNYGFVIAGLVVLVAGLYLGLRGSSHAPTYEAIIGLLVGSGTAVSMLSARSTQPIFLLLVFLPLSRALFRTIPHKNTLAFWAGAGLSFLAVLQLSDAHYREKVIAGASEVLRNLRVPYAPDSFILVEGLLAVVLLSLSMVEAMMQAARARLNPKELSIWNLRATWASIVAISALILVATNASRGFLSDNEIRNPLLGLDYVRPVIVHFLDQLFPISKPDFLLSTSFWGGFGWLDRLLPAPVVFVIKLVPLAAFVACGIRAVRIPDYRPVFLGLSMYFIAAIVLVGVNAYFVSGLVSGGLGVNLHGRYLIAPYLLLLLPTISLTEITLRLRPEWASFLLGGLLLAHAILWSWLLNAYFF